MQLTDPSTQNTIQQQLADMGLRPETAFGCAFRFLFEPNNVVEKSAAMEMARKFSPPQMGGDVLRIGLQVGVGVLGQGLG